MKLRFLFLVAAFIISFLFAVGLSLVSLSRFPSLSKYTQWVEHTYVVKGQLNRLESTLKNAIINEQYYLLTRNDSFKKQFSADLKTIDSNLQYTKELVRDNKEQVHKVVFLGSDIVRLADLARSAIANSDTTGGPMVPIIQDELIPLMKACTNRIDSIRKQEDFLLHARNHERDTYQGKISSSIKYLSILFSLLTLATFLLMLYEFRRRLQYQDEMHQKLIELQRSQSELEEIAFATSHDLQEPLRKIRIFVDRLVSQQGNDLPPHTRDIMQRISQATGRLKDLIDDLMNLTSLVRDEETRGDVDLHKILQETIKELDEKIKEKDAVIEIGSLPVIRGNTRQLRILFKSLLENALKFSKKEEPPVIHIDCQQVPGEELHGIRRKYAKQDFYCITVSDNGIGFDNKFADKIFQIFQRLHNQESEYAGRGIGLALAMRVMVNHYGFIIAHGHTEAGATFKLYFPQNAEAVK